MPALTDCWNLDFLPCTVGIKRRHRFSEFRSIRPEIFLEHRTVMIDDEGHHTGIAVLRGISDEREAADHFAAHDVIDCATGRGRPLLGQDLVVVAVIG